MPIKEKCGIRIPQSYKEAVNDPIHAHHWRGAMVTETLQLIGNNSWREVLQPEGANIIICKWVFNVKTYKDGRFISYKACLVACGFTQVKGEDYN